ncbi:SLATT domain-containing protein [Gemmatimonas aurantiaca]|uniref:SLATT domain-containing protein n=1 Tax=Gemmatimonas aurantiaca TaxID=173480 RepID=UPI00301C1280
MSKADLSFQQPLSWDQLKGRGVDEILDQTWRHISGVAERKTSWYWESIRSKRRISRVARGVVYVMLIVGSLLPLVATLRNTAEEKLLITQIGICCLVVAGLVRFADQAFGWSSGWMRYITTVTAMEASTQRFRNAWRRQLIADQGAVSAETMRQLFELAVALEDDLNTLQAEETNLWIAEFRSGATMLDALIKGTREQVGQRSGGGVPPVVEPQG